MLYGIVFIVNLWRRTIRKLYLDIETAPHSAFIWSLWQKYTSPDHIEVPGYTLCWAAKWEGKPEMMFSSVWGDGLEAMTKKIHALLNEADAVIHYNGRKFDIPMLQTEFLLHGLTPPKPFHQIDLYPAVRRAFRFPSNKLDYVCKRLKLGKKVNHKGMELWMEAMEGNEQSCKKMETYNKQDVRLLPKLYKRILPWIHNHPNEALYTDMEAKCCIRCGSTNLISRGFAYTTTQRYRRYLCKNCGGWNRDRHTNLSREAKPNILTQDK